VTTKFYLPSAGDPLITPSSWEFDYQIASPLTLAGRLETIATTMTSKTAATGTTSGRRQGVARWVIGPLAAQTISGTIQAVMRVQESNAAANAQLAIAAKIIQPDGSNRAVLLNEISSDSATSPYEFTTSLASKLAYNASEGQPISLTSGDAEAGDFLVIEIGFRSATTTSYTLTFRVGDSAASDLTYGYGETNDYNPWVQFSADIQMQNVEFINQHFQGTGFDNGEDWITYAGDTGKADPDATDGSDEVLEMKDDDDEGTYAIAGFAITAGVNGIYGGFKIKFTDLPSATVEVLQTYWANGDVHSFTYVEPHECLFIDASGYLRAYFSSGNFSDPTDTAITLNTWYYVWFYFHGISTANRDGWIKISTDPEEPETPEVTWRAKSIAPSGATYTQTDAVGFTTLHGSGYSYRIGVLKVRNYSVGSLGATSPTISVSLDALIQKTGITKTLSIDALIQVTGLIGQIDLDALLWALKTKTVSIDAILEEIAGPGTELLNLDALIQQADLNGQISIDALIMALKSSSLSLDAILKAPKAIEFILDALIQLAGLTSAISLDAILMLACTDHISLDALIQGEHSCGIRLDAHIGEIDFQPVETLLTGSRLKNLSTIGRIKRVATPGRQFATTTDGKSRTIQ
jgi:hypothetical protein